MKNEINAIITIAARDVTKLFRDRLRIVASFVFPMIFIGVLGSSLQANIGENLGYNFITFVFMGVLAQTLFQSTAAGLISLVDDRQNDFAQELFISPISRYSIVIGKILGETLVSLILTVMVIVFGLVIGIDFNLRDLFVLLPVAIVISFFGGAFGLLVMSNVREQRSINQIFPFIIFPQFFLAGVFNPIQKLPLPLLITSRIAPMTYAVDLFRSMYYLGKPEYSKVVLFNPVLNGLVVGILSLLFIFIGTFVFVRNERNR